MEGNIIEVDKVKDQIVDHNEIGYGDLPSVNAVETSINNIIENIESNHDYSGNGIGGFGSLQDLDSDTRHLADRLSAEQFKGTISAVFGGVLSRDT